MTETHDGERVYTTREAARLLGSERSGIAKWAAEGRFPHAYREATEWRIPERDLARMMTELRRPVWPRFPGGWHTVTEVSRITGRPRDTVHSWIKRDLIPRVDGGSGTSRDHRGWWLISGEAMRHITRADLRRGNKIGWARRKRRRG